MDLKAQPDRTRQGLPGFCARVTLFLALQIGFVAGFTDWRLDGETNFLAATLDKHRRAAAIPPPRLFLVGGSSVAFGFDSPRMERALNRPVVNLSITAGLGMDFFLREVERVARSGDWIVLSPEYSTWYGGRDRTVIRQLLECSPARLRDFAWRDQVLMVDRYGLGIAGGWLRRAVGLRDPLPDRPDLPLEYRRSRLNARGDYIGHWGLGTPYADLPANHPWRQSARIRPVEPRILETLQRFLQRCKHRGITVFHVCPAHPPELFQTERESIESNFAALEGMPGLVLLDRPSDAVFPFARFYDTRYHLTREGMEAHADRIIGDLRAWRAGQAADR